MEWLLIVAVIWLISAAIGAGIGSGKGRGFEGFVLGLILGVFGVIIIALLSPSAQVQARRDQALAQEIARATGASGTTAPTAQERQKAVAEAIRRDPSLAESGDAATLKRLQSDVDSIIGENRLLADLAAVKAQKEAIQRAQLDMVMTMRKEKELAALNPITRFRRSDPLAFWVTAALLLVLAMYAVVTLL